MKRAITWCIAVAAVIIAISVVLPLHVQVGYDAEDMRQGKLVVDDIKAQDKTINASWRSGARLLSYTYGGPVISVYAVTDSDHQDAIVGCIREMKQRGLVNRTVRILFYERENMIYTPVDKKGFWGAHRGPEKLIRDATL
jgi:hypothetical protein